MVIAFTFGAMALGAVLHPALQVRGRRAGLVPPHRAASGCCDAGRP